MHKKAVTMPANMHSLHPEMLLFIYKYGGTSTSDSYAHSPHPDPQTPPHAHQLQKRKDLQRTFMLLQAVELAGQVAAQSAVSRSSSRL